MVSTTKNVATAIQLANGSAAEFAGALKNLSPAMINQLVASGQLSVAQVQAAVTTDVLTEEEKKAIQTQVLHTTTTTGAAGATKLFDFSLKGLLATMQAFAVAHPVLAALAAIAAAVGVVALVIDGCTYSQKEQNKALEEARQKYDDVSSELESMRSELDQVQAKMKELEAENIDLGASDEYQELKLLNDELEREIRLKEREAAIAAKDQEDTAVKNASTKNKLIVGTNEDDGGVGTPTVEHLNDADYLNRLVEFLQQNRAERAGILDKIAEAQASDDTAMEQMYRDQLTQHDAAYDEWYDEAAEMARNNQDLATSITGVTAAGREMKPELEASVEGFLNFADGVDLTTTKVEETGIAVQSFESIVSSLSSGVEAITSAQEDMAETGYLSADSVKALKEAGLDEYLVAVEGGYQLANGALDDYIEAQRKEYTTAISKAVSAGQDLIDSNLLQANGYDVVTMSIYDQIRAMEKLAAAKKMQVANEFLQRRLDQGDTLSEANRMLSFNEEYQNAYNNWLGLANVLKEVSVAERNLAEFDRAYATTKRDHASKDTTDPNKSAFEEEYAKQKHQLELGKKTLKEFNDWLAGDKGYKYYFKNQKDYAEEWRKYEKEVFDNSMQLHDQEATNIDHTIEMLKLQNASEQDILAAYREKQSLLRSARDTVYDFLKAQGLSEEQIRSNGTWQELMKSLLEVEQEALEFHKERVSQVTSDFDHEINMLERRTGAELELVEKYREKQRYLTGILEEYKRELAAAGKTADEIAKDDWVQELVEMIADASDSVGDALQGVFDKTSESLNDLLELTEELIRKESEDQIEALEDQKDAFSEIIDAKKEMLRLTKEEQEYNDKVAKSTKDIAKLQSRIDALAMDDSRQAALERGKLEEELAEFQKELADTQNEHYISKTEDALDKEEESYHELMDSKIDEIEAFLDDNEAMTNAALDRLNNANESLFDDLMSYAKHYTDTTGAELQAMWDDAMAAAKRYGDFTGAFNAHSDGSSYKVQSIVSEMQANGAAWGRATTDAERKVYEDANVVLAQQISNILGVPVWRENGTWYISQNGQTQKLYDVYSYHTGGVVGPLGSVSPKSDELFTLLQTDEVVMSRNMVDNTYRFLTGIPKVMASMLQTPLAWASQAMSGAREYVLHISAPLTMEGVLPSEEILSTIKQYPRKVAEVVAEQIQKL